MGIIYLFFICVFGLKSSSIKYCNKKKNESETKFLSLFISLIKTVGGYTCHKKGTLEIAKTLQNKEFFKIYMKRERGNWRGIYLKK